MKATGKLFCVGCYQPPWSVLLDYLTENLDTMLMANECDSLVVLDDLN